MSSLKNITIKSFHDQILLMNPVEKEHVVTVKGSWLAQDTFVIKYFNR